MAIRSLPYLLLLFPLPHIWLLGRVMPLSEQGQLRDVGGAFLLLFDLTFVLLTLALLKFPWIRLRFKWAGLVLLLSATLAMWQGSDRGTFSAVYLGGWLVLLALAGLWLYRQRTYLD